MKHCDRPVKQWKSPCKKAMFRIVNDTL